MQSLWALRRRPLTGAAGLPRRLASRPPPVRYPQHMPAPMPTLLSCRAALPGGVDKSPLLAGRVSSGGRLNVAKSLALLRRSRMPEDPGKLPCKCACCSASRALPCLLQRATLVFFTRAAAARGKRQKPSRLAPVQTSGWRRMSSTLGIMAKHCTCSTPPHLRSGLKSERCALLRPAAGSVAAWERCPCLRLCWRRADTNLCLAACLCSRCKRASWCAYNIAFNST